MGQIIQGMINTESFNDSDRRPKDWREMIMYLYPNGTASLTALLSLAGSGEVTTDPHYFWWTKKLPTQTGTITGVYTDVLTTVYNPTNIAAAAKDKGVLYFKLSEDDAMGFRKGHQVLLRDTSHDSAGMGINAEVTEVVTNGVNSYLKVRLLQDDFAVTAAHVPGTFDHAYLEFLSGTTPIALVIGNMNEEGADTPKEVVYEPIKMMNHVQIFRTSLSITRTAKKTKLRTGDHVKQAKKEALELHGIEMERAFMFGKRSEVMGPDGNPLRTTAGILNTQDIDGNYLLARNYFSGTWRGTASTNGFAWLMEQFKTVFEYGNNRERLAFCGPDTLLQISYLAQDVGQIQLESVPTQLGINVTKLISPFGTVFLKQHPLFNAAAGLSKSMLIIDDDNIKYRYIDDTHYLPDRQGNGIDGETSEYLTEGGLELHHPETFMYLGNIGG